MPLHLDRTQFTDYWSFASIRFCTLQMHSIDYTAGVHRSNLECRGRRAWRMHLQTAPNISNAIFNIYRIGSCLPFDQMNLLMAVWPFAQFNSFLFSKRNDATLHADDSSGDGFGACNEIKNRDRVAMAHSRIEWCTWRHAEMHDETRDGGKWRERETERKCQHTYLTINSQRTNKESFLSFSPCPCVCLRAGRQLRYAALHSMWIIWNERDETNVEKHEICSQTDLCVELA